jgi:hypothetical protein
VRPGAWAVFVAILVFTHLFLHAGFGLGGSAPDLLAIAVLLTARRVPAARATLLALFLGFLDDAFGVRNLGARSVSLGIAAVLGTWSKRVVEGEGPLFVMAYLFVGKWVIDATLFAVVPNRPAAGVMLADLSTWSLVGALYAAVAGTLALAGFRLVMGPDA